MASIVPVAFQVISALQTVSSVAQVLKGSDSQKDSRRLAVEQLQQQQNIAERSAAGKAALDKQELAVKTAEVESERRSGLKRAVARQRAKFGAQGVSSGDGSSEAVLLGLFEESEEEKSGRERLDNIRLQAIDQGLTDTRRVNTLERTQLAEKNRLKNSSSTLDTMSDLLAIFPKGASR